MPPAPSSLAAALPAKRASGKLTSKPNTSKPCKTTAAKVAFTPKSEASGSTQRRSPSPTSAAASSLVSTPASASRAATRSPSLSSSHTPTSASSSSSPRAAVSSSSSRASTASNTSATRPPSATNFVSAAAPLPTLPDRSVFAIAPHLSHDSAEDEAAQAAEVPLDDVLSMLDDLRLAEDVRETLRSVVEQSRQSAQAASEEDERGRPAALTMATLVSRCFSATDVAGRTPQQIEGALSSCRQLILDRLSLTSVELLASAPFAHVTHLYLQHNLIEDVAPLTLMLRLRFVSLAHNDISAVPDLTALAALRFIDLSDNRVDDFEPELLPLELQALRMRHNPCSTHPAYQHHLLAALPYLTLLDDERVTDDVRASYGLPVGDGEEEEADDGEGQQQDAPAEAAGVGVEAQHSR